MRFLVLLLSLFALACNTVDASAKDVLTLVYSANSDGEYAPCPT